MTLDLHKFDKYIPMFIKGIEDERPEPKKSR